MRMFHTTTLLSLVVVGLLAPILSARGIEDWPYDRLFKEADLVVIARAKSSEPCDDNTRDNIWKEEFLGVNTAFSVKTVLKGKCEEDKITVLHFKLNDEVKIQNGPLLISFRMKPTALTLKDAKVELAAPDYMLFLKATKDGRFEPVSGRIDPQLSVKEVHAPYRFLQDDAKKERQPK
jgi:hypothetical protein